jgi:hypothetical protein
MYCGLLMRLLLLLLKFDLALAYNLPTMVITIKKGDGKKEIEAAVKKLSKKTSHPRLADFYGKLKGQFGDGLAYQKKVRDEWE